MKEPIIHTEVTELSTDKYLVAVSSIKEDDFPMYAVINRKYKVVEFTSENYNFIEQWLQNFDKKGSSLPTLGEVIPLNRAN